MSRARAGELRAAVLVAVLVAVLEPAGPFTPVVLDPPVALWAPEPLEALELLDALEPLEPPQAASSRAATQANDNGRRFIAILG